MGGVLISYSKLECNAIKEQLLGLMKERAKEIRPQLGDVVPLLLFRLHRFAIRQVTSGIEAVMYTIGKDVSRDIIVPHLGRGDLESFLNELGEVLRKLSIGILTFEKSEGLVKIRIDECAMSYKTPNVGRPLCYFEGGLIAGALEGRLGRMVQVTETRCCGMGHDYCEFTVRPMRIEEIFLEALKL